MGYIAVIDTETNWYNDVMSIGVAVAEEHTFELIDARYYVLEPEAHMGGMYSDALGLVEAANTVRCTRREAMEDLRSQMEHLGITRMFAYNARFDCNHLPELSQVTWYDIMRIAAYRQYNARIPSNALCCSTGRLKRNYGVEPIIRMLSGDNTYSETHNALLDAVDELQIMKLLGLEIEAYECARL